MHLKSIGCALASFISGVFIDIDHLFDYYSNHRTFTLKIQDIYETCAKLNLNKFYILLHSYELIALLWASIYLFSLPNLWKATAIGLTQHLIFDQITNPVYTFGYFITYRMLKGFKKELLLKNIEGAR